MRAPSLILLVVMGCATQKAGKFGSAYYQHGEHPYVIWYASHNLLMGPDWQVDNFGLVRGVAQPKTKGAYSMVRGYDTNNDGQADLRRDEQVYDVLLDHIAMDAELWVRTVPIDTLDSRKQLRAFAERYVRNASGAGTVAVPFGAGVVISVERRFATRVIGEKDCTVADKQAYRVDFEVANVDELKLSESARWSRGSLVIVRAGFGRNLRRVRASKVTFPVLMLVGASATPRDYPAIERQFERLLDNIAVGTAAEPAPAPTPSTCRMPAAPPAPPAVEQQTSDRPPDAGPR